MSAFCDDCQVAGRGEVPATHAGWSGSSVISHCVECWRRCVKPQTLQLRMAHGIDKLVRILGQVAYREAPCPACECRLMLDGAVACPSCGVGQTK